MANSLNLKFYGLSIQEPYKTRLKLTFNGLYVNTQKQSFLKFWGLSEQDADAATMIINFID